MTMSCPEVMYQAYYPYLYQRASTGAAVPRPTFPSPFTHQYDRLNVQRSFQEHVHSNLTGTNLSADTSSSYLAQHSQQSCAESLGSSGPCNSPESPSIRQKEENIREGGGVEDGASDDEGSSSSRAQYVSANCVVFTHYTGDVATVVDEHFSRALSYSEKSSSGSKDSSPMSSRNFPPSFWNSNYQSPTVSMPHHGELYGEYQHAGAADPWHAHYQQYTAAAHHHRAVHDYHHHHHNTVAQYSGLLLPRAGLAPQYGKDAWTPSHATRLHDSAHSHSHFESTYSAYPSMSAHESYGNSDRNAATPLPSKELPGHRPSFTAPVLLT